MVNGIDRNMDTKLLSRGKPRSSKSGKKRKKLRKKAKLDRTENQGSMSSAPQVEVAKDNAGPLSRAQTPKKRPKRKRKKQKKGDKPEAGTESVLLSPPIRQVSEVKDERGKKRKRKKKNREREQLGLDRQAYKRVEERGSVEGKSVMGGESGAGNESNAKAAQTGKNSSSKKNKKQKAAGQVEGRGEFSDVGSVVSTNVRQKKRRKKAKVTREGVASDEEKSIKHMKQSRRKSKKKKNNAERTTNEVSNGKEKMFSAGLEEPTSTKKDKKKKRKKKKKNQIKPVGTSPGVQGSSTSLDKHSKIRSDNVESLNEDRRGTKSLEPRKTLQELNDAETSVATKKGKKKKRKRSRPETMTGSATAQESTTTGDDDSQLTKHAKKRKKRRKEVLRQREHALEKEIDLDAIILKTAKTGKKRADAKKKMANSTLESHVSTSYKEKQVSREGGDEKGSKRSSTDEGRLSSLRREAKTDKKKGVNKKAKKQQKRNKAQRKAEGLDISKSKPADDILLKAKELEKVDGHQAKAQDPKGDTVKYKKLDIESTWQDLLAPAPVRIERQDVASVDGMSVDVAEK